MTLEEEKIPLIKSDEDIIRSSTSENAPPKVYATRWLILTLFYLTVVLRGLMHHAWSPIIGALGIAYDWTKSDLALISGWAPLLFLLTMPLYVWFVNAKGLRVTTVLQVTCSLVAAVLKCLSSTPPYSTWLMNASAILNAPGAIYQVALPSVVSNTWFPLDERALATAVGYSAVYLGAVAPVVLGPIIVRIDNASLGDVVESDVVAIVRGRIMTLNYIHLALSLVVFASILCFFRERPPTPPSTSSQIRRYNFGTGIRTLATEKNFWLVGISLALLEGTGATTFASLGLFLQFFNIPQSVTPALGGATIAIAITSSIVVGKIADAYVQRIKILILAVTVGFVIVILVFVVYYVAGGQVTVWVFAVLLLCLAMVFTALLPLTVEYLCDLTYPVDEAISAGVTYWMSSLVEFSVYMALMLQAGDDMMWLLETLLAVGIVFLGLVSLADEDYRRRIMDALL